MADGAATAVEDANLNAAEDSTDDFQPFCAAILNNKRMVELEMNYFKPKISACFASNSMEDYAGAQSSVTGCHE
ncbi:hypothetical protein JYU29_14125 [Tianweitania sp. BSSL-BM11]|uniref:Uncharacterized protein n=1 Tax=Tianweitania aestuarii TaxID=2814886 RepID=A0ABS5RXN6_9HYPH|nr:hypothetical protein [Tianweitania aestuarii]MBS9721823.1 hypothetical protein [Tianweitania aestuarii]